MTFLRDKESRVNHRNVPFVLCSSFSHQGTPEEQARQVDQGRRHNYGTSTFGVNATQTVETFSQADSSAPITLRTRKFITNRLLARRQFVLDVLHPSRPNVSKTELSEKLAALYKTDKNRVVTFGFKTQFGGGRSTGFALIYDDEASQKKFEPRYRLVRVRCGNRFMARVD